MLNAMQHPSEGQDYEKLDFLFWKSREKAFKLQERESGNKTNLDVGALITFFTGTTQTAWVKWSNKIPEFVVDAIPGVEGPYPEPDSPLKGTRDDPWKRNASVTVVIDGKRRQFSVEGVTAYGVLTELYGGLMDAGNVTFNQIAESGAGVAFLPDFSVTYDGVKEFDSKAGVLGKPVWKDLKVLERQAEKKVDNPVDNSVKDDDIPF